MGGRATGGGALGAESSRAVAKRALDSLSFLHDNSVENHLSQDAIFNPRIDLGTSRWDSLVDSDEDMDSAFAPFDLSES